MAGFYVKRAFSCYWDDVKTLGVAFWINIAVIAPNAGIAVDALQDYFALRGFLLEKFPDPMDQGTSIGRVLKYRV